MSGIAAIIQSKIHIGQTLLTPGQGQRAHNARPFRIIACDEERITFEHPSSAFSLAFDVIEAAVSEVRKAGDSVPIGSVFGWAAPGTFQRYLQDARGPKGGQGQTASYVAPLLVECGIAEYTMIGQAKGLRLIDGR